MDLSVDFTHAVGQRALIPIDQFFELRLAGALAAPCTCNAEDTLTNTEVEHQCHAIAPVRNELRIPVPHAWNLAVEGEQDSVEEARLAGTSGSGDREQPETGKIELLALLEAGEPFDLEAKRAHLSFPPPQTRDVRTRRSVRRQVRYHARSGDTRSRGRSDEVP